MINPTISIFSSFVVAAAQTVQLGGARISLWWWPFVFTLIRNLYLALDLLLLVAIVMLVGRFKTFRLRIYEAVEEAVESGKLSKGKVARKWEEIKLRMDSEDLEDKKQATEMAEEMLDGVLISANIPGENLENRLARFSDSEVNFKDDIIWAHRLTERMRAGEEGYEVDEEEVNRAFYILERTMKELNIL